MKGPPFKEQSAHFVISFLISFFDLSVMFVHDVRKKLNKIEIRTMKTMPDLSRFAGLGKILFIKNVNVSANPAAASKYKTGRTEIKCL